MTRKEQLVVWLTDAYAMEVGLVSTLEKHANDALDDPKALAAVMQHLEEARAHGPVVAECLASLGAAPSTLKAGFAKVVSFFTDMPTSLAPDSVVKNAIGEIAAVHYKIASYAIIIQSATALKLPAVVTACRGIERQARARASVLGKNLRVITREQQRRLRDDFSFPPPVAPPSRKKRAAA